MNTRTTDHPFSQSALDRDLQQRAKHNRHRAELMLKLEAYVAEIPIDWEEFHDRLAEEVYRDFPEDLPPTMEEVAQLFAQEKNCSHTLDHSLRILKEMGLSEVQCEACREYFPWHGGRCDCEVSLNEVMIHQRPHDPMPCSDCGVDYDEFYMVHKHIWSAVGVGDGWLCIGCLEQRLGRKLNCADFTDAPCNTEEDYDRSLRLQDRLAVLQ
jgi:hypothetical protein